MGVTEYDFPLSRPEPPRDGFGRYLLPAPDGSSPEKAFTRATTIAGSIDDKYNIGRWRERLVADGFRTKPELLESIDPLADDREVRDQLQAAADEAFLAAGGDVASRRGTQLHTCTELVDMGIWTLEDVPEEYRREVTAYRAALDKHGIRVDPEAVERIVYHEGANIVGTADRLPVIMPDGTRLVADVKSGRDLSYSWGSISMQLAIYADASAMAVAHEDGSYTWEGMPVVDPDTAIVFHIPVDKGKCDVHLLDLRPGRMAVDLALDVRAYRRKRGLSKPLAVGQYGLPKKAPAKKAAPKTSEAPAPDSTAPTTTEEDIYAALDKCKSQDDMAAVWTKYTDAWEDKYTEYGLSRLAEASK